MDTPGAKQPRQNLNPKHRTLRKIQTYDTGNGPKTAHMHGPIPHQTTQTYTPAAACQNIIRTGLHHWEMQTPETAASCLACAEHHTWTWWTAMLQQEENIQHTR